MFRSNDIDKAFARTLDRIIDVIKAQDKINKELIRRIQALENDQKNRKEKSSGS